MPHTNIYELTRAGIYCIVKWLLQARARAAQPARKPWHNHSDFRQLLQMLQRNLYSHPDAS